MKNKSFLALFILVLFLFGGYGAYLFINTPIDNASITIEEAPEVTATNPETIEDNSALIFYSTSCPHCEVVAEYLKTDGSALKINVKKLKVDDPKTDTANIEIALNKIKECNLKDDWGVPLMYHNGICIMGDQPIIDYLNQQK